MKIWKNKISCIVSYNHPGYMTQFKTPLIAVCKFFYIKIENVHMRDGDITFRYRLEYAIIAHASDINFLGCNLSFTQLCIYIIRLQFITLSRGFRDMWGLGVRSCFYVSLFFHTFLAGIKHIGPRSSAWAPTTDAVSFTQLPFF